MQRAEKPSFLLGKGQLRKQSKLRKLAKGQPTGASRKAAAAGAAGAAPGGFHGMLFAAGLACLALTSLTQCLSVAEALTPGPRFLDQFLDIEAESEWNLDGLEGPAVRASQQFPPVVEEPEEPLEARAELRRRRQARAGFARVDGPVDVRMAFCGDEEE